MASMTKTALTMQQRLDVLKDLETSTIDAVAKKYNVHRATINRIRQKVSEIKTFEPLDSKIKQRKRNRKPMHQELEKRLLTWFFERRAIGAYISDALLLYKAVQLKEELGVSSQFKASKGWLAIFKKRNNIRLIRAYDENASADANGADQFVAEFCNFMQEQEINPENVYNMDETRLLWKALSMRTLEGETKKSVSGHKIKKDTLTLGLCANSTGTHKLMPLLIYKYKQPRALRNSMDRLPVVFRSQLKAWMNQTLFTDWFENHFKKSVQQHQLQTGLCGKVILLLDNCASHKFPPNYVQDENFIIKYLPPNTTSLIQPMEQGIIKEFKRSFRHKMPQRLLLNEADVINFYKQYTIQHCINMIDEAWREITKSNIRKAWNKIITPTENREETEEEEEGENVIQEMQQILTPISEDDEIEEYFHACKTEESRSLETFTIEKKEMDEEWDEERDEEWDKEWDEERNEERDEKWDAERNEERETLQRGIPLSTEEREKLKDLFRYLESFKNRVSPSTQFHIEGLKMTFLSE